jgi:phosphopantothenoylcysteine synthetase/decarboxylase
VGRPTRPRQPRPAKLNADTLSDLVTKGKGASEPQRLSEASTTAAFVALTKAQQVSKVFSFNFKLQKKNYIEVENAAVLNKGEDISEANNSEQNEMEEGDEQEEDDDEDEIDEEASDSDSSAPEEAVKTLTQKRPRKKSPVGKFIVYCSN